MNILNIYSDNDHLYAFYSGKDQMFGMVKNSTTGNIVV